MSDATAVPSPTFGPLGFIPASDSSILAGTFADINQAFGGDCNPAPSTPQGQIAASNAAVISNTQATFCNLTQQVDPAYNYGRMQDAIGRIYFIERLPALPTTLQVNSLGGAGVTIPYGALIQDATGNIYSCLQAGMIPVAGNITLPFAAQIPGPTPVPDTNAVSIYQSIPGWDSVTVASGTVGQNVESRAAFEARRAASVAGNSLGTMGSIIGAVSQVNGVLDYFGYDNGSLTSTTILGVTVPASSIYVAVVGGTDLAVAQAILSKKGPGCAYYGNTPVTAYDSNPLYVSPIPYSVSFERPGALDVVFAVNIVSGPTVPSNAAAQVQAAIVGAFAGTDGGPRARIGSLLLATRYYAPVAALGSWAQIRSLQIGSTNTAAASFTGVIVTGTLTVSGVTGTIVIGQTVSDNGANIPQGTTITGGSGTTWTLSNSGLSVTSEAMFSLLPDQTSVQVQANQAPSVSVNDVAVIVS